MAPMQKVVKHVGLVQSFRLPSAEHPPCVTKPFAPTF